MNNWAKLGLGVVAIGAVAGAFYGGIKFEEDRAEKKRLDALKKRVAANGTGPKLIDALAGNASNGLQSLGVPAESVDAAIRPPVKTGEAIQEPATQQAGEQQQQAS